MGTRGYKLIFLLLFVFGVFLFAFTQNCAQKAAKATQEVYGSITKKEKIPVCQKPHEKIAFEVFDKKIYTRDIKIFVTTSVFVGFGTYFLMH